MRELGREASREAFTGETTGWVLNFEVPTDCASGKATSSPRKWLAAEEPRAVENPMHVETFFRWKLGGLIRDRRSGS